MWSAGQNGASFDTWAQRDIYLAIIPSPFVKSETWSNYSAKKKEGEIKLAFSSVHLPYVNNFKRHSLIVVSPRGHSIKT